MGVKIPEEKPEETIEKRKWLGTRHIQIFCLFLMFIISFGMKVNLSIGIIAMTDPKINPDFPTVNWSQKEKSFALSALYIGYVLPQVGAGQLADKFGAKWILTWAMASCVLYTFLIPKMAEHSLIACVVCRILQGFSQGFFSPCAHNLLSKWIPRNERSLMGTFVYSGTQCGVVLGMYLTGMMSSSPLGWPSAYYLYASLGILWTVLWSCVGESCPANHRGIGETEKTYITTSEGYSGASRAITTPWKPILKSLPVWAILVSNLGHLWGYYVLLNELPTYLSSARNYDMNSNGLFTSGTYLSAFLSSLLFAYVTDRLINSKVLSITIARKLVTSIGLFVPGICLLTLGMSRSATSIDTAIILMTALTINSAVLSGFQVNHIDIAPTYAGSLMGLTNSVGHVCGIITPIIVPYVVRDEHVAKDWSLLFVITAGVYLSAAIFYIIFASGDIQKWDRSEYGTSDDSVNTPRETGKEICNNLE